MSNSGKFSNRTPFIREAGITSAISGETVDLSLRQDLYFRPLTQTPEHIRKYRRSTKEITGKKQIHYGVYNDPKDFENLVHGVKTKASEHVPECIKAENTSGIKYFLQNIKEDNYKRSTREPLGKSLMRNYIFPEIVQDNSFKFGVPTLDSIRAKDVLYTSNSLNEDPLTKKLYSKTHGHTDPGEQKNREYNWPVDKRNFVFGLPQKLEFDGTKKSLRPDKLEAEYPVSKIVDKRVEDFQKANSDIVGIPKFKGTMSSKIPGDFTFGIKTKTSGNAASCLSGQYEGRTAEDNQPDPDLGRSFLYRSKLRSLDPKKNEVPGHNSRSFGVPSIRSDLKRNVVSICDQINYGKEKDVFELLYPNAHCFKGLDNPDFETKITKENLKEMLDKNNHSFDPIEFDKLYEDCLSLFPDQEGKVSFVNFIEMMRNYKREYVKYRTLVNQ